MSPDSPFPGPSSGKHPIRIVAQRTGLKADLIRAWERRYGAIQPQRSSGRHRFYSDADIERLILLRQATSAARTISQLADLDDRQLRQLIEDDRRAEPLVTESSSRPPSLPTYAAVLRSSPRPSAMAVADAGSVHRCLEAVRRLDSVTLSHYLDQGVLRLGYSRVLRELVEPLWAAVENLQQQGLRSVCRRFAGLELRAFIHSILRQASRDSGGPRVVVATPLGNRVDIGALLMAAQAVEEGWEVTYLATEVPAAQVLMAARTVSASVVMLDLSAEDLKPAAAMAQRAEILELRRGLGPKGRLLATGPSLEQYGQEAGGESLARLMRVSGYGELKTLLAELQTVSGGP